MFSKQAKTSTAAAPEAPLAPLPSADATAKPKLRAASLLSDSLTIEGNLASDGEVQVDGVIRGDVRVAKLTVGETGHIEGQVFSEVIEVRGRVIGAITAKQVRLYSTGYVDGDITHEQLSIEAGAFFQGRSLKFQRPASQPNLQAVPEEPAPGIAAV
ncbi:MAG TPA: polymer-forming cytoskeletal protein [Phenylobacterium sp.]|nr:polymer-forming cytoskeletal protein [Phenylobacterium sp.]